jgi:hypothetical protein
MATKTNECPICEINTYSDFTRNNLNPAPDPKTFPCALANCPYETAAEQAKNADKTRFELAGKWGSTFQ